MMKKDRVSFEYMPPTLLVNVGAWEDSRNVVHAVNARTIWPDIDIGCETACGSVSWDSENPQAYPTPVNKDVDCMTCVVQEVRLCRP